MREKRTIPELLQGQATERPESIAVADLHRPGLSYRRLDELARGAASQLAGLGVRREDRVAIVLPNGPEMATALLAVTCVATAAPLNPGLTRSEFAFYLDDLDARLVVVADNDAGEGTAAARDLDIPVVKLIRTPDAMAGEFSWARLDGGAPSPSNVAVTAAHGARPHDAALVLHTSGTTAKPKIVPLSHENLCRSASNVAASLQLGPEDRCMNVMPLFHIHGLVAALLASVTSGATVVCTPGFEAPNFFEWFETAAPTWYTAVPTMHQSILARSGDDQREIVRRSQLRLVRSSSASLPQSVLSDLEEAFGVPVIEAYGMTEAAHQIACNPLPPKPRKPGSVGPAAGPDIAIADSNGRLLAATEIGEVVIRGSSVTDGYVGMDDHSAHYFGEGWFRTGDQGYLDSDDYLFLTGRLKEIINRGGETIAPKAIDEELLGHPQVRQAVTFAVPDRELGEEVAAAVILDDGAEVTEAELHDFLLERLSWARMPKRILFLDEIPMGATGKLQRIGLAQQLGLEHVRKQVDSTDALDRPAPPAAEETMARLTTLWQDVLKDRGVGPDDPFLDVGGDSITATSLVIRVEQEFAIKVPLMAFFDATTIRRQAALIDQLIANSTPDE